MAYYSKYTGAELEERLDKVEEIPQLIAQMITGKDFVTKEDLLCVLKDYAPADYRTIPIDNNTIYWENGVLKAATSDGTGQCQWELREHNGIQYLYSRLPVVTQYDVTMYADVNHLDLPSIYDGLPIDGDTIYWEETENGRILKSKYEGSSGVDASEVLSIVSGAGYATQNWVNNRSFITQSYLATELLKYVTLDNYQEIIGVKNFINGLQISNIPIKKLEGYDDILYIDSNVVIRGGLTMYYEDGEINLPSIKEEIGNAGYDGVTGLASFNSSQFYISSDGTVTIIGGSAGLDTAQLKEYLDSNKYTTETWVKAQGYASASSLSSLQIKVNNFLEGSDTDTIINKWKELELFLSGLSESDNLADILATKANQSSLDATNATVATKWTQDNNKISQWNTAYGWGNHSKVGYALKSYVDNTFVTIKGNEDVTGVHDFVNGLKIGNIKLSKSQEGVVYLEGNLVVKGGVTMYALDEVTVDSIIDSLPLASTSQYGIAKFNPSNFVINEDGFVTIIGGSGGLDTEELADYLTTNKYATQGWVENKKYLTSHQQIYNLTISKNGTIIGIYTPNSSPKSLDIIVPTKLSELDNDSSFATTNDLDDRINDLINGAPAAYDTLKEIADVLSDNIDSIGDILTTLGTKANNSIKISAGTGLTGGGDLTSDRTLSLDKSGVSAGTYKSVTVDIYGRVTSGYNPTTLSGYGITDAYTKTQLDNTFKLYIPIAGYTEITGEKNFIGGLRVNNSPVIYYDEDNKYWKLEGDLLVTGGVSMYSDDTDFIPSTIMDAVVVDGTSIRKNPTTGALEVIGGSGSTTKYPLSWSGFNQGSYDGSQAVSFYIPTKLSEFINDSSFATTGDLSNYQTKITSSNKLSYSLISGTPTSLPASDVYTWAKASVKPSYMWSEIGEKPTFANVATSGKYSDISGTPSSLKNPNSLKFGSKTYDGSSEQTILASDLGAITSHQTIYTLTFQSGTFSAGNFTANNAKQTINVPTTTSHISEGSNLYFTNARALSALKSTTDGLASDIATKWTQNDSKISNWDTAFGWGDHSKNDYTTNKYVNDTFVTLKTEQTITGKKDFTTGGLFVNGKQIHYDATNKYWKLEGDLLVTGGVTMYGDDGSGLPSIFDSLPIASNTALGIASFDSTYFSVDANGMVSLTSAPSSGASSLGELLNVDASIDATASVDRVLYQPAGSAIWTWRELPKDGVVGNYLPLSGGTISGDLTINNSYGGLRFINTSNNNLGFLGYSGGSAWYLTDSYWINSYSILHSGNYSSYALPLSGGTINGSGSYSAIPLVIKNTNSQFNGLSIYANTTERVHLGYWSSLGGVRLENVACSAGLSILDDKTPSYYKINSDGTFTKNTILHAGNYSSYALPLSGGTIKGLLSIRRDTSLIHFGNSGTINYGYLGFSGVDNPVVYMNNGTTNYNLLHSGNYSSYALPLTGGTLNGSFGSHYIRSTYNNSAGFSDYEALNYTRAWFANTQTLSVPYNSVQVALGWSNWLHGQGYHTRYTISSVRFNGWGGMSLAVGANDEGTYRGAYFELWGSGTISAGGNLTVSGGITMYSDIRKKTKLQDVELNLSQIANAPLIQHYYNSDQNKTTHVGSIAQYWAGLNDWFCKLDAEGYYTMEIQNCALASAISIARHLEKYESKTDKKIRQLKKRISQLEDELELLKKGV